jgi:hypothetical protein
LVVIGIGCRLAFVTRFPTLPFSDFLGLIDFGFLLRDHGLAAAGWHWTQFNPGLPIILSILLRFAPPEGGLAFPRLATAVATGLVPLAPFLLWRRVLPFGVRLSAGLLLALWPGQVFFSGVVAQDNWVLLPAVALASLAVRRLLEEGDGCYPVFAGLLYSAAVAIRQEMLLVLLPLLLTASFGPEGRRRVRRNASLVLFSVGLPLVALVVQRGLATGRYTLTTEHGGLAVLGSFIPGAFGPGWIDPRPFVTATEPALVADRATFFAAGWRLAWREAARRPAFHALRMTAQTLRNMIKADGQNLFWSLRTPEVLPPERRAAGENFARAWTPWLYAELAGIQGLFAAAALLGFWRRDPASLVICLAVGLKVVLQAVLSPMSRLFLPATALELLVIALACRHLSEVSVSRRAWLAVLVVAVPTFLVVTVPRLERRVERWDRETAGVAAWEFPGLVLEAVEIRPREVLCHPLAAERFAGSGQRGEAFLPSLERGSNET